MTSYFEGEIGLLAAVGNTPLIPLNRALGDRVPAGVEVYGKGEWLNPGGSVKDRAALSMVRAAERAGRLRPGMTLLDASSGNTGIAYAMICAERGYKLKLCLPANANGERKRLLKAYGAEIVLTDPLEGSDGAIRAARELAAAEPELLYLDQYGNDANWQAHFFTTGPEIWAQTQGRVTHFVSALGTSGTFMGTSRFLNAEGRRVVAVEVQPDAPFHGLEGLKHMETAIVPPIYDPGQADIKLGAPTEESYALMRLLARNAGVLVGPSAGAAVWGAVQVAQGLERGVVVTVLCDSGTRYLSEAHLWSEA